MSTFLLHLTQAFRRLLQRPGFTLAAVLTLALGIGANTAAFSLMDRLLLSSFPYREPERIVTLYEWDSAKGENGRFNLSAPTFQDIRQRSTQFESITGINAMMANLSGFGEPVQIEVARVSASFFPMLNLQPMLGRSFVEADDQTGAPRVAILSHPGWQRTFGADPGVVGKTLTLNGESHTIVGVLGPEARFPFVFNFDNPTLFRPMAFSAEQLQARNSHNTRTFARLKPGATLASAEAELKGILAQLAAQYPNDQQGRTGRITAMEEEISDMMGPQMIMLQGVVLFVMLIACVNVASLMLANGLGRQREMATRVALGAARSQLMGQLLTESALLGLLGFLGALGVGKGLMAVFPALLPAEYADLIALGMDGRALAVCLGSSILAVLVFGLLPAWKVSRIDPAAMLKSGAKGSSGREHHRLRRTLVVFEVALASCLLITASLLLRSLAKGNEAPLGFEPRSLQTASFRTIATQYPTAESAQAFMAQVIQRLATLPGVKAAALTTSLPQSSGGTIWYDVEGQLLPNKAQHLVIPRWITPDYFSAMGVRLLQGRAFTRLDPDSVCIVSDRLAQKHWPGQDPLGKRISLEGPTGPWLTVVGLAGWTRQNTPGKAVEPEVYLPFHTGGRILSAQLALRVDGQPQSVVPSLRKAFRELDPNLALARVYSGEELLGSNEGGPRLIIKITAGFSALALLLAGIGIYGVMSLLVEFRTREIGVRMALGARVRDVLRLVLIDGLSMVALGLSLGLLGGYALGHAITSQLYGITPGDPTTYVIVSGSLALVALLSTLIPARRAATVNPVVALRDE